MALSFKRMTIFCHDIEKSLHVYRDVLGLKTVFDKAISGPAAGSLIGLPTCDIHIYLLATAANEKPVLGLFDVSGTELGTRPVGPRKVVNRQTSLVLGTDNFDATLRDIRAAGLEFLGEPGDYIASGNAPGEASTRHRGLMFFDPDDVLVSISQILPVED